MAANVTTFAISLCVCCVPVPGWEPWQYQSLGLFSGIVVVMQFVLLGFFLADTLFAIFAVNVFTVWFVYFLMLPLQRVVAWMRPVAYDPSCFSVTCPNSYLFGMINEYAFPEPLLVTGLVMWVVSIFINTRKGRKFPYFVSIVVFLLYLGAMIAEVTLQRQTIGQLFANLGLSVVIGVAMGFVGEMFYGVFKQLRYDEKAWANLWNDLNNGDILPRVTLVYDPNSNGIRKRTHAVKQQE
jgi:hypothetical protein